MIKLIQIFFFTLFAFSAPCQDTISLSESNHQDMQSSFYNIKVRDINGNDFDLSQCKGKKVVVVNVASECGYTPQYADWQAFYKGNAEHGLIVIGVPCNQFGEQEPGSSDQIVSFCEKNYGVTFPILEKSDVKGDDQSTLFHWLTNPKLNGWNTEVPSWNFCKYLIDEHGKLIAFFKSDVLPQSEVFISALQK